MLVLGFDFGPARYWVDLLMVFKSPKKSIGFPIKNTTSQDVPDPSVEGGVIQIPSVYDLYFPDFFD